MNTIYLGTSARAEHDRTLMRAALSVQSVAYDLTSADQLKETELASLLAISASLERISRRLTGSSA